MSVLDKMVVRDAIILASRNLGAIHSGSRFHTAGLLSGYYDETDMLKALAGPSEKQVPVSGWTSLSLYCNRCAAEQNSQRPAAFVLRNLFSHNHLRCLRIPE